MKNALGSFWKTQNCLCFYRYRFHCPFPQLPSNILSPCSKSSKMAQIWPQLLPSFYPWSLFAWKVDRNHISAQNHSYSQSQWNSHLKILNNISIQNLSSSAIIVSAFLCPTLLACCPPQQSRYSPYLDVLKGRITLLNNVLSLKLWIFPILSEWCLRFLCQQWEHDLESNRLNEFYKSKVLHNLF